MNIQTKNLIHIFVNKSDDASGCTQINNPSASGYIADGEVAILGNDGYTVVTNSSPTIATQAKIKLVQRANDSLYFTPFIDYTTVKEWRAKAYVAPVDKVSCFGYCGTNASGTLDVSTLTNDNFILKLTFTGTDPLWSERYKQRAYVMPVNGATQQSLASYMHSAINKDWQMGAVNVYAKMWCDSVTAAITEADAVVTNGSNRVTFAGASTFAVGDVIRFVSNAVTAPVYIISKVISTTVYELNSPYTGTSGSSQNAYGLTVSGSSKYGVSITGIPLTFNKAYFPYLRTNFIVQSVGFGSTTFQTVTDLVIGNGSASQVGELEWQITGDDGALNRMKIPMETGRYFTDSTKTYNGMYFNWSDVSQVNAVSGIKPADEQCMIFTVVSSAQGVNLLAGLNSWMNSAPLSKAVQTFA